MMQSFHLDNYPRNFDLGEILSIAKNFYFSNFQKVFIIAFICFIPVAYLISNINISNLLDENIILEVKAQIIFQLIGGIMLNSFATVAITIFVNIRLEKTTATISEVFKEMYLKIIANIFQNFTAFILLYFLIVAWFLLGFFYPMIFLILFIPSVISYIFISFTFFAFGSDDINLYQAMRHSLMAVFGRWGRVFLYSVTITIMNSLAILLLSILSAEVPLGNFKILLDTLLSALTSYFLIVNAVFYLNLKHTARLMNDEQFKFLL